MTSLVAITSCVNAYMTCCIACRDACAMKRKMGAKAAGNGSKGSETCQEKGMRKEALITYFRVDFANCMQGCTRLDRRRWTQR